MFRAVRTWRSSQTGRATQIVTTSGKRKSRRAQRCGGVGLSRAEAAAMSNKAQPMLALLQWPETAVTHLLLENSETGVIYQLKNAKEVVE